MKFLSVVCSMLLVIFVGGLMQAPASVEQPSPIVNPAPDAGTPFTPIGRTVCPDGYCPSPNRNDCATCPESPANGGDCKRARTPVRTVAAVPVRVAGRVVGAPMKVTGRVARIPVKIVGRLFGRGRR